MKGAGPDKYEVMMSTKKKAGSPQGAGLSSLLSRWGIVIVSGKGFTMVIKKARNFLDRKNTRWSLENLTTIF
jgi:hypothetical protein